MNKIDIAQKLAKNFNSTFADNSFFLSFEGIEGSGKSTQIKLLEKHLRNKGYDVLCLREPGGTKFGEDLRNAILQSETDLENIAEAYLFAASRAQLLKEKIYPFLAKSNSIVILDRYIDSSVAYQGFARGLGIDKIYEIHNTKPLNILPNLTFYLKISLEKSMERQSQRGLSKDYVEKENHDFYNKLINGYDTCAEAFSSRVKTINGENDLEKVSETVLSTFSKILKP